MASTYVMDYVSGQEIVATLFPQSGASGVTATGLQRCTGTLTDQFEITTDTTGVARYRDTGPLRASFSIDRWQIQKEDLPTLLGLKPNFDKYGNYNWKKYLFDLAINYVLVDQNGVAAGTGGVQIHVARLETWAIDMTDPYAIVMENITGMALAITQQPWAG